MAWEMPQMRVSQWSADVDMTAKATWQFAPIWLGTPSNISGHNGAALVAKGALTYPPLGILQNNPRQGEAGLVVVSGISKYIAAGTIAVGDPLTANGGGTGLIKATSGYSFGFAVEPAVSGDLATGQFNCMGARTVA